MDALSKVPFYVISMIDLWQIFQLPELPEHSSANVTYVMLTTRCAAIVGFSDRVVCAFCQIVRHPCRPSNNFLHGTVPDIKHIGD